jgi:Lon protease-like protein
MNELIPIFPLNITVYPNSKYPLHIFEERYKILIAKCLKDNSGFGICANFKDGISEIGVYVKVIEVIKRYPKGEVDIVVVGESRFIRKSLELNPDGYYISLVEEYVDLDNDIDQLLFNQLENKLKSMLSQLNFNLGESFWNKLQVTNQKAFKIAEKSGLTIYQQQEILLIQRENERLNFLLNHLENLKDKIKDNLALKDIIMADGYLN